MSSQSFVLVVEYAMAITGANFNDVSGIERLVAFFAKCPSPAKLAVMRRLWGD